MLRTIFLICLLTDLTGAQIVLNPPRERPSDVFSVDVELVSVYCTVRDQSGAYVRDLSRQDFELKDNGKTQEIRNFSRDVDAPITLALLVDVSGSVMSILDEEKSAANRFLKAVIRPSDKALLVSFASNIAVWQEFTGSLPLLLSALERLGPNHSSEFRSRGGTLLYDAVNLVTSDRLRQQPGRKTMIVITDGLDSGSLVKLKDAAKAAQQSDAVVYAIYYEEAGSGNDGRGLEALKKMAEPTGGRVFEVRKKLDFQATFDRIQEEMRSQYSLSFRPPEGVADGKMRKLEVRVRRPGARVYAREGYYLKEKHGN